MILFYHHIVGEDRGDGGPGDKGGVGVGEWRKIRRGSDMRGEGAGKKSEFWAGVPEKNKGNKGAGVGRKKMGGGRGGGGGGGGEYLGVWGPYPLSSSTILLTENQEFLQWITTIANPLSPRDSWVVNRIVTEVYHCSAEYSIALYQYICILDHWVLRVIIPVTKN